MAKKFGRFLLFTAAVGTAAAAAYYYMQQKDSRLKESSEADDDYDDFHEDLDESTEFSRNYVPLNASAQEPVSPKAPESSASEETSPDASEASGFTPLSSQTADLGEEDTETAAGVEEFFDEEDPEDEEPPMPKED